MTASDGGASSDPPEYRRHTDMDEILERGRSAVAHPPRRRARRIVLLILVFAAGSTLFYFLRLNRELDCIAATRAKSPGVAVVICKHEYEETGRPLIGSYYADALRRAGQIPEAIAISNDLLGTELRGDALQMLGKIDMDQGRADEAIAKLQEARQLHRAQGNHKELARDDTPLAKLLDDRQQYSEALQLLDECIVESRVAADDVTETICHLTAARVLTYAGFFEAAQQELDRAAQQATADRELAQVWYWRGNLEQEIVRGPDRVAHNAQAVAAFERSLELAKRAQLNWLLVNIHLNLTYSLAESGRPDAAEEHLAQAGLLDDHRQYESERGQLSARIALRRGNLSLASTMNDRVYPTIKDLDDQVAVCVMQARIALEMKDLGTAVLWAKRGVDGAERIRAAQTASELRPWVLATRRDPFEVLFTALARAGRVQEAVSVFDQWEGRTLLDEMARPKPDPSPRLSTTAIQLQSFARWLPAVSRAPLMTNSGQLDTHALAMIDLVALAVAEDHVWRITSNHGRFKLDDLGQFRQIRDRLDRFIATPTDPALARELGALILPDELVRATVDPLYVVLDAPLAGLPFVALRRGDEPLVAVRPVLRAPRIPVAGACSPRAEIRKAVVLADAAGDLPEARLESSKVASMFGATPLVGAAATSAALFAAKSDPLLHVAVHADVDAGGGILRLHDRAVSAPEISAKQLGPSLVVLSACSTARAWDPEFAGSLSTAFLAGGSHRVVATLRSISDTAALQVTAAFYDAGGAEDPVHALAKIQTRLAATDNKEWPYYAVFGSTVCAPPS